jgi:hypothetical protein
MWVSVSNCRSLELYPLSRLFQHIIALFPIVQGCYTFALDCSIAEHITYFYHSRRIRIGRGYLHCYFLLPSLVVVDPSGQTLETQTPKTKVQEANCPAAVQACCFRFPDRLVPEPPNLLPLSSYTSLCYFPSVAVAQVH